MRVTLYLPDDYSDTMRRFKSLLGDKSLSMLLREKIEQELESRKEEVRECTKPHLVYCADTL